MLVGLYGGTFDPVHLGHIHAALVAKQELCLSQVRMVLAARPGHRVEPHASSQHRWEMLRLACAEHGGLIPDAVELQRKGMSYTIDTVEALHVAGDIPCWILGQDAFATLPAWHRWQALMNFCNLVVVSRPGDVREEPREVKRLCDAHEVHRFASDAVGQVYRLRAPMLEISATQVRALLCSRQDEKLTANEATQDLLADPVCTYITQYQLYQTTENSV